MKMTSIGLIPEDWDVKTIGDIATIIGGGTPSTSNGEYWDGPIQWFTPAEITGVSKYIAKSARTITPSGLKNSSARLLPKGAILLTTRATIGAASILLNEACTNQGFQSLVVNEQCDAEFLYYLIPSFKGEMMKRASGSTFVEISAKKLASIEIPLPPIDEQRVIVKALSGIDELISFLDKAIEKKHQIKEGLMQNFLTGRTRLSGFDKKWIDVRLGDVCMMNSGGTPSTSDPHFYGGDILFLSISDMTNSGKYIYSTEKRITEDGYNCSSARMFPVGTLMYAMYASLGKCAITKVDVAVSQAILGFHSLKNIDTEYLYYYLTSIEESVKQTGQTGTQSNLSKNIVENFHLSIPTLEEQQAIASLLRTVDDDIDCCITKREKYNLIKQGMMQELLTGKTRLV